MAGPAAGRIIVVIGLLAGLGTTGVGLSAILGAPNAARDFRVLPSKCVITSVAHEAQTLTKHNHATKKSDPYCQDMYTYTFSHEAEQLVSNADSKSRLGSGACSSGDEKRESTHKAGESVTCYQPTQTPVNAVYGCGNTACIKVVDPAGDLADYQVQSSEALYFGIGLLAFFFLVFLCLLHQVGWSIRSFVCCAEKDDDDSSED